MDMGKKSFLVIISLLFFPAIFAQNAETPAKTDEEPPLIFNFSLPASQQPGPFISFGQNILDAHEAQLYWNILQSKGEDNNSWETATSLVYGLTDNLSVSLALPYTLTATEDQDNSAGIEDMPLQLEYVLYTKNTKTFSDTVTVVGNMTFPTGSGSKDPATGYGSPSFFIGTTYNRSYVKWFGFTSEGTVQTTSKNGNKFGNQYLYQLGLGKNIYTIDSSWVFAGLIELDGTYTEKDQILNSNDPNSGGNVIFITPSVWISSKKLILQFGAGQAVIQHLNGVQNKNGYLLSAILGWTL